MLKLRRQGRVKALPRIAASRHGAGCAHAARGFTLIELLVVIAIIGLLVTLSVLALSNARVASRDSKRMADIKQLQTAMELFYDTNNRYPTNAEFQSGSLTYVSSDTGTTSYISIPTAPTPNDGACSTGDNAYSYNAPAGGSTYTLNFCVSKKINDLPSGQLTAIPGGIVMSSANATCDAPCNHIACGQANACGGICACSSGLTCNSGICQTHFLQSVSYYANNNLNVPYSMSADSQYIYLGGNARISRTSSYYEPTLTKINKDTLNIEKFVYVPLTGTYVGSMTAVVNDDQYLYTTSSNGPTNGFGNSDIWLRKFNKSDLSLVNQTYIGGPNLDYAGDGISNNALYLDGNNLYLAGYTLATATSTTYDCLVVKMDKNFAILAQKRIGKTTESEYCSQVISDDSNLYVLGRTSNNGASPYDIFLLTLDKNSLQVLNSARFVTSNNEYQLAGLVLIGSNLYAAAWNASHTLLFKYDKSSLQNLAAKVIVSSNTDRLTQIFTGNGLLYLIGLTNSAGVSANEGWITTYNPDTMAIVNQWTLGDYGTSAESFLDAKLVGNALYLPTTSVFGSYNYNVLFRLNLPFPNTNLSSTPARWQWRTANFTQTDYAGTSTTTTGLVGVDDNFQTAIGNFPATSTTPQYPSPASWDMYY